LKGLVISALSFALAGSFFSFVFAVACAVVMFPMTQVWGASGFNTEGIALIQVAKSPINILLPLTCLMLQTSFLP